jgi:hypothetical protein
LNPGVIGAWRDCKLKQQDLTCWVSPRGKNQLEFHFNWTSGEVALPVVSDFNLTEGASSAQPIGRAGDQIYIGEGLKVLPRDPAQDSIISLQIVLRERFQFSCVGYVPHDDPPFITVSQLAGKWCQINVNWPHWEMWSVENENTIKTLAGGPFPLDAEDYTHHYPYVSTHTFLALSPTDFEIQIDPKDEAVFWSRYRATPDELIHLGEWRTKNGARSYTPPNPDPRFNLSYHRCLSRTSIPDE